jgi:uncharacterized membrane protein
MLMTMEMWWLGFYMEPLRLALLMLLNIPLLIGLSYYGGFEATPEPADVLDAFAAYAVGFVTAVVMLSLFAIIETGIKAAKRRKRRSVAPTYVLRCSEEG